MFFGNNFGIIILQLLSSEMFAHEANKGVFIKR